MVVDVKNKLIKWFLKRTKLYYEYNQVSDIFKEPFIKCFIGKWRSCPGLPVYRGAKTLWLANHRKQYIRLLDNESTSQWMYHNDSDKRIWWVPVWTESYKKKHPYFTKFFKPTYKLPYWTSCGFWSNKLMWKWKYDDVRFEFNPQMTLVLFGYCVSIWLKAPYEYDYDYWESILTYLYKCDKDLEKTKKDMGGWERDKEYTPACNSKFLKKN